MPAATFMWVRTPNIPIRTMRKICGWMVIFWTLNIPPFVAAYLMMGQDAFTSFSLLYLGLVSIIALIAAFGAWWQSLQIEEHQQDDADVQDVVDLLEDKL